MDLVKVGFYNYVVECLRVHPATWGRFPTGTGGFKQYFIQIICMQTCDRLNYFRSTTQAIASAFPDCIVILAYGSS